MDKLKDLWYTFLGKAFSIFAQVMVKVQPIWDAYKVVISLVLGLLIGWFVIGWGILIPKWQNATPAHLRADFRSRYLAAVAQEYVQTQDMEMARDALGLDMEGGRDVPWRDKKKQLKADIEYAYTNAGRFGIHQDQALALEYLLNQLTDIQAAGEPSGEGEAKSGMSLGRIVGLVLALLLAFGAVVAIFVLINRQRSQEEVKTEYEPVAPPPAETGGAPAPAGVAPGPVTEAPVKSFTTTYVLGDDYFDPSFSIEIGPDFLGECGIGISETIGAGDPKKVTAFEGWLFDKSDIRTLTTVLASDYAVSEPDLRAKLEPKGEIEQLAPGMAIMLETTALRVQVTVKELEYAQGNLPDHSFIQKATFELQAWVKADAADLAPE